MSTDLIDAGSLFASDGTYSSRSRRLRKVRDEAERSNVVRVPAVIVPADTKAASPTDTKAASPTDTKAAPTGVEQGPK